MPPGADRGSRSKIDPPAGFPARPHRVTDGNVAASRSSRCVSEFFEKRHPAPSREARGRRNLPRVRCRAFLSRGGWRIGRRRLDPAAASGGRFGTDARQMAIAPPPVRLRRTRSRPMGDERPSIRLPRFACFRNFPVGRSGRVGSELGGWASPRKFGYTPRGQTCGHVPDALSSPPPAAPPPRRLDFLDENGEHHADAPPLHPPERCRRRDVDRPAADVRDPLNPDDGYCAQVWPPATGDGAVRFSMEPSPSWPWKLYPQQRPSPAWVTPQVW